MVQMEVGMRIFKIHQMLHYDTMGMLEQIPLVVQEIHGGFNKTLDTTMLLITGEHKLLGAGKITPIDLQQGMLQAALLGLGFII